MKKGRLMNRKNIFQIWKDLGEKVPFTVRRLNWEPRYGLLIEKVVIEEWPEGKAFGYPTEEGEPSNYSHLIYPGWRKGDSLPNAGTNQWILMST